MHVCIQLAFIIESNIACVTGRLFTMWVSLCILNLLFSINHILQSLQTNGCFTVQTHMTHQAIAMHTFLVHQARNILLNCISVPRSTDINWYMTLLFVTMQIFCAIKMTCTYLYPIHFHR